MRRRRLIGVYRGLLKSIEVPWLQCGIKVRGGETGTIWNQLASPFTPKTYPIDQTGTIDISRLVDACNGQLLRRWIALTPLDCCAKRAEFVALHRAAGFRLLTKRAI
jgi:hypothetical protein